MRRTETLSGAPRRSESLPEFETYCNFSDSPLWFLATDSLSSSPQIAKINRISYFKSPLPNII